MIQTNNLLHVSATLKQRENWICAPYNHTGPMTKALFHPDT
jgi:hypothetical protein